MTLRTAKMIYIMHVVSNDKPWLTPTTLPQSAVSPLSCGILGCIAPRLRINRVRIATEVFSRRQISIGEVRGRISSLVRPLNTHHVLLVRLFLTHVFNSSRIIVCTLNVCSKTTNTKDKLPKYAITTGI